MFSGLVSVASAKRESTMSLWVQRIRGARHPVAEMHRQHREFSPPLKQGRWGMSQIWHACRLSKTYVKDANEVVKRARRNRSIGWSPSTLQAEPSGSAIWKFLEDRGTVIRELDDIQRDLERASSISMECLS